MRTGIRRFGILAGLVLGAAGTLPAEDADAKKAHDEAVKTALDAFRKAYKGGEEERAAAVQGLSEPKDRRMIAMLAKALADPSPAVRIEAAGRLGGYEKSREAGAALLRGLTAAGKQPEVQIACLNALGSVRDWNAAPVIMKHFNETDSRVGTAAIQAAGRIKNPVFVKELIKFLDDMGGGGAARSASIAEWRVRRALIRAAAHRALCDITGEQKAMPADPAMALMGGRRAGKEWEEWWKVYGARVTAKLQQAEREEQARIALEQRPYK